MILIDTLIFDLSEVLIFGLKGVEYTLAEELHLPAHDVLMAMLGEPFSALMRGQFSERDYLTGVLERTAWPISLGTMQEVIRANMLQRVPGSIELLHELAQRHPLYLVSDHATEWVEALLPQHPFLDLFQERFWSCELGSIKRDPETFPLVLDQIGHSAKDCLFVDDNPENIASAARSGIPGIVFEDADTLRGEFQSRGLLIRT